MAAPQLAPGSASSVLTIRNLVVEFVTGGQVLRAVDGLSLDLPRGRTLGLVGESGSGKSVTALSILRLVGGTVSGSIEYGGKDLLKLSERELRELRGNRIAMIFQDPMTSLNPVIRIGDQVAEALRVHGHRERAKERAATLLAKVGIPEPAERARAYPHELSGGMRQRVMIAMALACGPDLLIADEPTTALDVTIQAQILDLLARLQRETGMSVLLITHDLSVVAEVCDEVAVMYAGQIVEHARKSDLFRSPRHPYTAGLLRSTERLEPIPGVVPDLRRLPTGCRFSERCNRVQARCRAEAPQLDQGVRCFFPEGSS